MALGYASGVLKGYRQGAALGACAGVLVSVLAAAGCNAPARGTAVRVDGQTLELQRIVDEVQRQSGVPALAAAWARSDGSIHAAVAGTRTAGKRNDVMQIEDRVRLGLVSNQFVAITLLMVLKQTPLNWESTVEDVLRELAPDIRPEYRGLTVAHLTSRQAAIPPLDASAVQDLARRTGASGNASAQRNALARWVLGRPRSAVPVSPAYPDVDYLLLAQMMERAAGQPLEVLMERGINALGDLKECAAGSLGNSNRITLPGHVGSPAEMTVAPESSPDMLPAALAPVADVRCSIAGLAQFARAQVRELRDPQFFESEDVQRLAFGAAPPDTRPRLLKQTAGATSFATQVTLMPDEDLAIVVAANAGFGDRACDRVTAAILEAVGVALP